MTALIEPFSDYSRLCVHTITTRPWSLEQAVDEYQRAGVAGITVWRQALEGIGAEGAARLLAASDLEVVSLCRGGFFPATTEKGRQDAIDDNLRAIDEAAAIGAPLVVLVCGAVPGMPLAQGRKQIFQGIEAILPHAEKAGVRLAIEPLHPMYSDSRSAINTMEQANDMVDAFDHPNLGITVDVYHVWWDEHLRDRLLWAGERIFSFHVCDWLTPTSDILNDRGLMGEGCLDLRGIREMVETGGFRGFVEVEVFSNRWWARDQREFLERIQEAWRTVC